MTPAEQAANREELVADLAALKRLGVAKFKGAGIDVEFFPPEPQRGPEEQTKPVDEDICACGHHKVVQHTNGMCVEGCDAEQCNPEKK